ncbi:hypothetical protein PRIPAC_95157 [Pristionchus pacificus]|uniref:Uncharacterized protein n=1 Tax=Pristionchus pacificus TaxID=54126 RepID=A0A2A6BIM8_PRIPA|nr:hypothetical protein PRIPAC_95157 [Pristionchus pacificus]|eukprot:PDM65760.1 hypothetical protein PRIPAC_45161 [Pristionchus pacificus]
MSAVHLDQILRSIGSCTVDAESLIPESQEWPLRRFQHGRTMVAPDQMRPRLYTVRSCPLDTIHDLGREGAVQCCDTIERRRRSSSAEPTLQLAAEQETRRRSHIRGALKFLSFQHEEKKYSLFAIRRQQLKFSAAKVEERNSPREKGRLGQIDVIHDIHDDCSSISEPTGLFNIVTVCRRIVVAAEFRRLLSAIRRTDGVNMIRHLQF